MNPFATHIPILLACLRHTTGPVLELGSGWFSTPILSAFATDRLVRTVETNREWHSRITQIGTYQPITNHRHQIVFVPDYNDAPMDDHDWSIVLLDHEPPPRRGVDAARLRERSQLIIGHDSEHPAYGYDLAFDKFKYKFTYSRLTPWTTVVTGAPFVEHGKTGFVVDRLPPGASCVGNDEETAALAAYQSAVEQAQALNRKTVRQRATEIFDTTHVVDRIIEELANIRELISGCDVATGNLQ